ncbi:hypothetical protein D0809_24020 [Flavobacterium circumlabens]|uniref:Uncharacterized protein n=1 Tax=Flavobacterium circumlabens TaxID=2133765 RepID=A0A4Y7U5J9_9FLAO|nr:hypothetical protein [Flavobacterium circumlabens]TCN50016.1 hypothetical protein EV142_11813 [Flavobacterium circumlabens]TEB41713.1 hypothetical protein D0809_24020 [Flavobacterium circumlabens]
MKNIILIIFSFVFLNCGRNYEIEEDKAINDIVNDYLKNSRESNINVGEKNVFISDALIPISQIKEDDELMFINNSFKPSDSIIFYQIVNSNTFKNLKYREFNKGNLQLDKPYKQSKKSDLKVTDENVLKIIKLSRICFDDNMENGVAVIEYMVGNEYTTENGYNGALLLKKVNNKWTYVR